VHLLFISMSRLISAQYEFAHLLMGSARAVVQRLLSSFFPPGRHASVYRHVSATDWLGRFSVVANFGDLAILVASASATNSA
jgi:hypothetical protein